MKNQLPTKSFINGKSLFFLASFFLFSIASLFSQDITLEKLATEGALCNQFDITLNITGNPPSVPTEVILVIDRSGSMGFDIPNDPLEPIDYAKDAAIDFVNNLFTVANNPTGLNRIAIVSYSTSGTVDEGFVLAADKQDAIDAINALVANGGTNIARAMDVADNLMTSDANFDCATARSIVLLTDGVTNRDLGGNSCTSSPTPPFGPTNTVCMQAAIDESIGAQTTDVNGTTYNQSVFSVGLFGAIEGNQQAAATYVLDGSQNSGLFVTENAADLSQIYNDILGQLIAAATQLPGQSLVSDVVGPGFSIVPNTVNVTKGTTTVNGNAIAWFVNQVLDETITMTYTIEAMPTNPNECGTRNIGSSVVNFQNSSCTVDQETFLEPEICVPCPELTNPEISQVICTNFIDYMAEFTAGECGPITTEFTWEFFLNNVSLGTVMGNTLAALDGTYEYTGTDPFEGEFKAVLTYDGTYNNNCTLPEVVVESAIDIFLPPDIPMAGDDQAECLDTQNPQTLTATANVPNGQSIVWYDAPTNGNVVPNPTWSSIGSITYYAEAVDDVSSCASTTRLPVMLTLYDCAILIEKSASPNNTQNCNTLAPGEDITYTFLVTNQGNVAISNVELNDPLIDPVNPIPGPASGDTNTNGILETGETWEYTATYTVVQADILAGQVNNTADVDGTVTGSSASFGVNDSDSETVVLCQDAEISITKLSDGDTGNCNNYSVNDVVNYSFTVTNEGDVDIADVVVTDPNLGGPVAGPANGDTGNDGILGVGEVWTYEATYNVTQADIDAEEITNTANVNGTTGLGPVTDTSNTVVLAICTTKSIALIKVGTYDGFDQAGNCTADVGDTITYAFTVTNTGNVTLTDVVVTDPLVTMVGGPIASLAPGAVDNTTFTASYIITQADLDAGQFTNQATATGTPPSGPDVTDLSDDNSNTENDPTVTTICNAASIALIKVGTYDGFDQAGNCTADVGDTITYAFTVTNTGNVTLTDVVVTDPLVTMVGGPIASLAPGAVDNTTFTASYIITQADLDAGQFTNQATATGTPPSGPDVTDLSDDNSNTENDPTVTTICNAASIALIKVGTYDGFDQAGNCTADVGDTITYAFTVTNTGNVTLTDVVVTDPLVTMVGGPIASLAPGASDNTTFTASYIITQADLDAGQFTNQATATGTPPSGPDVTDLSDDNSNTENDPTVTTICNAASIALIKVGTYDGFDQAGNCTADVGDTITYAFTVTNTGNVTLTDVVVTDPLVTMVGGPIASLAPGAVDNTTFTASYIITQADLDAGQFTNQATATGTPPSGPDVTDLSDDNSNTENDPTVTTICNAASIALIKVGTYDGFDQAGNCTADVGDTITYAFTVTNTGNVTLTDVVVTDPLVTMVGGPIASLAPGAVDNTTFTASYIITQADLDAGQFTNQATATGTPPSGPDVTDLSDDNSNTENDPTVTTICNAASIALIKVGTYDGFDQAGNCTADVGDTITYAFTVTNTGNVTLTDVVVTDPLVTMVGGPIASLAPGASDNTTFTASYIITQADLDAGQFTNQATATGTPPSGPDVTDLSDDNSNTENDPTVTTICNAASIALIKVGTYDGFDQAGNCTADVGDTITYAFTVTNTGNVTLTDVVVTDPLVTMVGGPIASLAPGAVDNTTFTASYIITQADLDAGQFTNQATATGTPPSGPDVTDLSDDNSNTENDPTVTTICNAASIALIKVGTYDGFDQAGNCTADVGDTITYAFTVTNTGNVTLTNVVVTDPLVTMVGGPIASLAPGAVDNTTFTASYIITQADLDAGQFTNQATATGTPPSGPDVTDLSDDNSNTENDPTVTTICNAASIALIKVGTYDGFDQAGNCTADVGDTITYAFTVTNTGNVTLTDVVVTDPLVTMVGGPIASLAPGAVDNTTFTASYIITQADLDAGQFTNQATATGTPPSGPDVTDLSDDNSNTENDPTVTTICNAASIALIKVGTYDGFDQAGNCTADVGDTITYAFTVTNTGNVTLTDVVVTDPLVTMVGGPIASLAPGAVDNTTFTASYIITQADLDAGQFTNQATATGTPPSGPDVTDLSDDNSNTENDPTVTTICNAASIALIKVGTYDGFDQAGNCTADVGDTITYAFTVTNTGNVTLTDVVVTDPLVTMVGGPIASLAPGAVDNTTFTASYIITQADLDAGQFTNQATATGTPPSGPDVTDLSDDNSNTENDPTVTTICNAASIALIKVGTYDGFDQAGNCTADVGDTITYAFTVTNTGNVTLTDVVVTDPLVTMVGGPIASLAPGAVDNTTFTASYIITQADLDAGQFTNQATATGTPPSGPDVTDLSDDNSNTENDPTVTTICNAASIALIKVGTYDGFDQAGNCTADVGDTITYAFTVTNTGNVTLTDVVVTDPLVTMVGGPIASLAPGAVDNTTFTASYIITQADLDAGQFTNQATATGTPPSGPDVTDLSDDNSNTENDPTVTTICNAASIALIKVGTYDGFDQAGNCTADVGDTITYAFTVTNTGNVTLTDVVVTDPLVTMVGGPIASLAPGASDNTTFTASYIITQADLDAGQFTNQATATGTPPSGPDVTDLSDDNSNTENDPTVTTICNAASIALIKVGTYDGFDQAGNCTADVGDTITYAFTVTNTGNVTLTDVVVTDPLVTMVGGPIASLAPGAVDNTTFTASYIITQADLDAGQFTNQATATGTPPSGPDVTDLSDDNSNTENDPTVTTICNAASIALIKVGTYDGFDQAGNCTADVGDTITYAFTVTNTGNVTLTNVVVTDPLVTMVGGPIASLAPGAVDNTTFTASYIITQADLDAGQFTNQATATGTPPSGPDVTDLSDDNSNTENDPTVTTICNAASIALIKVGTYDGFDQAGNCTADVGDTITYAFTVTNTGNVTLTDVVVTDPLVTMVGGPIASLAPGAVDNTTFTASYIITQADLDAGQFTNQATATGTPPSGPDVTDLSDDNSNTENDPTVTTICNAASIALIKVGTYDGFDQAGNCTADVGDTITYAFTVTNTGNVTLTDVVVTDPLVTMVGGPIASLAPGAVDNTTFTASYIITQADLDAGQFTNQATATGTPPSGPDVTDLSDDNSNTENDPTVTTICNAASIALIKVGTYDGFDQAGNCTADVGDTITYAFTVTNTGNVTLTDVVVTDPLVTMVGGPIASLAPGAVDNTTFTASYIITQADLDAGQFTNQATATGTPPSGPDVTDLSDDNSNTENDPTVTTICNAASIALIKVGTYDGFDQAGNCTADVGDTITYAFTVTNTGNVTLTDVVVTDPLVTMVGGPIASLAPGAVDNTTFTASYIITQADLDAGQFTNQATATGTPPSGPDVTDLSDDNSNTENDPTVTTICNAASIALIKVGTYDGFDQAGNCTADVGDTITYAFTVTNTGNVTLTDVVVTDPLVTMVGGPIASLAPGAVDNTTFTASYIITQADLDAGQFTNQATATGTPPSGPDVTDLSDDNSNTENDPTVTTICNAASIALIKVGTYDGFDQAGNCTADVGDTITYAFTVTNTGNVTLTDVVVTDPLVTMVGGPIASLAPGAVDNTTFTASYIITQADLDAGQFTNQATATGTPPSGPDVTDLSDDNSNTENDPTVTTICRNPVIAIVKTGVYNDEDQDQCSDVDETITYTFVVTNEGNVSLSAIAVTDPLVSPITFVSGDINNDGILQVDESWTYTGSYIVTQDDIDAGQVTNQATATGVAPDQSTVTDLSGSTTTTDDTTVTTLCQSPAIAIVKEASYDDGGDCSDPGELINYTFTVTNEGNVSLANVVVTDPLLGGVVAGPDSGDTDGDNELDVTETWMYSGSYAITQDDIDAGQVTNQATATGVAPDQSTVTDLSGSTTTTDDSTVTTLCQSPAIAIVKEASYDDGGDCSDPGELINYTFTVTNEGNVSLANVVVTDPLLGGVVAGPDSGDTDGDNELDVTETWMYSGSYAITQDDIDAGQVTNQATATGVAPDQSTVTDLSGSTTTTDDTTVTTLCQSPAIAIVKEASYDDGGDCSDPGELINYTFTVTNEGNVSLANVVVTDPLLGGVVAGPDSGDTDGDNELDVTETWMYSGSYAITQDDIDAGQVTNQATATGVAPDQSTVTDLSGSTTTTDDSTVTTLCQSPAIAIVKEASYDDGGDCSDPGELINYTFTVTNEGNVSLANVVVTDPLLGGVVAGPDSGDTDGDNELDVTETWMYSGSYAITQDDIDAGQVTNQATATGVAPDQSTVTDLSGSTTTTDDTTVTTLCQSPAIAIVKEASYDDGGDCSDPGELINYTFTVTNEGNVSLANVVVTDPLLGGVVAGPDSGDTDGDNELDVTETWMYSGSYAITQDDIDAGQVTNQATATGVAPDQSTVTDLSGSTTTTDDTTVTTLCQSPAIAIVKEASYDDGGDCSDPGELINYTFTVTNEGNVSLANVVVTDPLLGGVVAGPDSGDTDGDNELDVTETWMYSGSYAITQDDIDAGQVTNQATATGVAPDQSTVTDLSGSTTTTDDTTVTTLCQSPAIAIVKEASYDDGGDCSDPGELINYTFTVTNEGNVSLANVVVTDPLLGGVVAGPDSGDTDGDNELDVTETWMYSGSYAITQDDIDAGQVTNQATATGVAPDQSTVTDLSGSTTTTDDTTVTTLCQSPAIAIVKEASYDDGGDCSDPGELINYTFTVTNEGNVSLANVVVTDPLLGGVVAGPDSGDTDGDNELDVTETWMYSGSYAITQDDIDAGQVTNQATATGVAPDQSTVTDLSGSTTTTDDSTVTTLCQSPAIAIVKEASYDDGGDCSDPGEVIDYTFTVTNEGNVSLSGITVEDPLLGGIIPGPDSGDTDGDNELDVTETWIYTGSYTITQDDIDAGEVVNQAIASGTSPLFIIVTDFSGSTTTTDDTTVTTLCQSPAIAIVKEASYDDGGDCSDPGEVIDYTFTVTNEGNVSLTNVEVNDPLLGGNVPGPDSGDTDGDNELDVTETWIYTGSYTITQDDIDAGQVTNQATATGVAPDQSTVTDLSGSTTTTDDTTVTTLCQSPAIAIVKEASYDDGGDCSDPGEVIDYTFTVTNEGNVSLTNVEVNDPLLGGNVPGPDSGDTDGDNELDVTETWIYTGSYTITQDDIDAGEVVNQATATGVAPDQSTVTDLSGSTTTTDDTTVTTLCQSPAIAIVKEASYDDGGDCSDPGEVIDYTFTVTNEGNVSLTNVEVNDPLLGGNVPGPDSGDTDGDNELDVTETWIYTGSYTITQDDIDAGEVVNQATATGVAPDQSTVTDLSGSTTTTDDTTVTTLCQSPAIAIVKTAVYDDGGDCSDPGEVIDYTFTVTNEGNVSLANVVVTDPLLGGVVPGPDSGDTDGDNELDVTETWIYTGSYTITQDDIDAGQVTNQATADGTAPDGTVVSDLSGSTTTNDDTTVTTLCQDSSIALIKVGTVVDDNGNGCTDVGETINYTFEVINTGNTILTNVIVLDPIVTVSGGPITLNVGETNSTEFTATYMVTQADVDAGEVINQALAEGTTPDGNIVDDLSDDNSPLEDDATITVLCQQPAISLEKTGEWQDENGDNLPQVGETIVYSFAVTNEGNVTLFNVTIEDPLPGLVVEGGPIAVLEIGETDTDTFTATYAITAEDIEAGRVINQAFATGTDANGNEVVDDSDDPTDLTNTDNNGDGDPDDPTIVILPNVESTFEIFNGVTPNGDGLNDFFEIRGISEFPQNNVKIFNRWGVLVFETNGYDESDNVFRGVSNGRSTIRQGEELPTGTYFYILTFTGEDTPEDRNSYNGYLYINR